MIIFNLWAIPVCLVIWLVLLGIEHWVPALATNAHFALTLGVVAAVMGGACELIGISGRLFLVPIWMLGIGIICFQIGWIGTLFFAVAVVAGAVVLFRKATRKERADWDKVQLELIKSPAAPIDGTEAQFWSWIKTMLFLPLWMKLTPEVCEHNLKILQAMKGAKASFSIAEFQKIEALEAFLSVAKTAIKPMGSEMKLQTPVSDLVAKKARRADLKKPFRTQSSPPVFARV